MGIVASTVAYNINRELANRTVGAFTLAHYVAFDRAMEAGHRAAEAYDIGCLSGAAEAMDASTAREETRHVLSALALGRLNGAMPEFHVTDNPYPFWLDGATDTAKPYVLRLANAWRRGFYAAQRERLQTTELPYCDTCGEDHVTVRMVEVGLCDDCAQTLFQDELRPILGDICARIVRCRDGNMSICIEPYGIEHDHSNR